MKNIVILGCGKTGSSLANLLSKKGHNIYIIERDIEALKKIPPSYGGFIVNKSIVDAESMNEIVDGTIDIMMVFTQDDDQNIFLSALAKEILNIKEVITRLYDEEKEFLLSDGVEVVFPSVLTLNYVASLHGVDK